MSNEYRRFLLAEVDAERTRQDEKWGGAEHDDSHTTAEFVQLIEDYAGWARTMSGMGSHGKARRRLVQVAALALAAVEVLDRRDIIRQPEQAEAACDVPGVGERPL